VSLTTSTVTFRGGMSDKLPPPLRGRKRGLQERRAKSVPAFPMTEVSAVTDDRDAKDERTVDATTPLCIQQPQRLALG
jgi:hypothetical protein